jgi:hypothetical protein
MTFLPSFKSELIAFRKSLDDLEANRPQDVQARDWRYTLALEILDRWQAAGDCEKIWKRLRFKLRCTPAEFIYQILASRNKAEEIGQRLAGWPALESKAKAQAGKHVRQNEWGEAAEKTKLAQTVETARSRFSRETKTAARNAFSKELSRVFQERCGQPFDWAVAALVQIAFNGSKTITPDAVRKARKNRTTDAPK